MPIIVQSTDTTGAGITLAAGDQFFLLEGTTIVATSGVGDGIIAGFGDDDIDITIAGTIIAANSAVDVRGDNINVTLTETATVYGSAANAGFGVLSFEGTEVDVTNHGLISSPDMIGVFFGDPNSSIHNTGIIRGSSGVLLFGADSSIVNSGSILGAENRSTTSTLFEGSSIYIRDDNSSLTNLAGGVISTTALSGSAVEYASNADGAVLDNFGTITSSGIGIEIGNTIAVFDIANYGVLSGGVAAIQATSATENVINGGIINGDVNLGGSGDSVRNTGQISGDIDLGTGDDLYDGNGGGTVSGTISGGAGADTIIGGAQSDVIDGGTEVDLIRGGAGDDVISGGSGNDTLRGGQGEDEISGGTGDDFIRGGAGDDIITGGQGLDILFGGRDADTFVFETASDSPDDNSLRDIIQDFVVGEDIIDLRQLGSMDYIGTGAFSGTGGAELQVDAANAIGRVKIFIDLDGDGTADMKIVLNNTTTLSEDDFLI